MQIIRQLWYISLILLSMNSCSKNKGTSNDSNNSLNEKPVLVGAIRWDAWYGGPVKEGCEKVLGPSLYQTRAPFFTKILSENSISIQGNSSEVMGKEIRFAVQSGLDYWAFLTYPWFTDQNGNDSTLAFGANLYLNHPDRGKINFCWIIGSHLYWAKGRWEKMVSRALETCLLPNYQKVLDYRPLIYFFNTGIIESESNIQTCRERLKNLSDALKTLGGREPYYVFMGWDIADWPKARQAGFHAWSFYAGGGSGTYTSASQQVRKSRWELPVKQFIPLVPVVSSGWNRLPRIDYNEAHGPLPWWTADQYTSDKISQNCELPQPVELAAHLADAIDFTRTNNLCEAKTCIIYAWNEHDEGGWLCPTVTSTGGTDSSRVMAVRRVLIKN